MILGLKLMLSMLALFCRAELPVLEEDEQCPEGTKRVEKVSEEGNKYVQCNEKGFGLVKGFAYNKEGLIVSVNEKRPTKKTKSDFMYRRFYKNLSDDAKTLVPSPDDPSIRYQLLFTTMASGGYLEVLAGASTSPKVTFMMNLDNEDDAQAAEYRRDCPDGKFSTDGVLNAVRAPNGLQIEQRQEGFDSSTDKCNSGPAYRYSETCTDSLSGKTVSLEITKPDPTEAIDIPGEKPFWILKLKANDVVFASKLLMGSREDWKDPKVISESVDEWRSKTSWATERGKAFDAFFDCHDYAAWRLQEPSQRVPKSNVLDKYDPDEIRLEVAQLKTDKLSAKEDNVTRLKPNAPKTPPKNVKKQQPKAGGRPTR